MKFKNLAKKLSVFAVGLGLTLGSVFGFAGCNPESSSSDEGSEPPVTQPEEPAPKESISFADFIKDHSDKAVKFVRDEVQPAAVSDKTVKSQSWSINANSSDELTEISIVYTYSVDKSKRAVEIAQVKLNTPVDLDEIVDGTYNLTNNSFKIDRTTVFEFDAKANYDNQTILDALYTADDNAKSTVKVYNEVESSDQKYRSFEILIVSDSQIDVDNIAVKKGNGSENDLLYNLSVSAGHSEETTSTYEIVGTNIYSTSYTLEDIENSTPDPEEPEEPDEPVSDSDIAKALNDNCKEPLVNRVFLGFVDLSLDNVSNGIWYVSKDTDGNITSAEYAFNYADADNSHYYTVGKIEFESSISAKNLQAGNLGNVTYSRVYRFNYNPQIQADRVDLTNAICETVFGINSDVTRFIFVKGSTTDPSLGQIGRFDVIQVTENGIEEASIEIKFSESDESYIEKLENDSNYNIRSTSSYSFVGQMIAE